MRAESSALWMPGTVPERGRGWSGRDRPGPGCPVTPVGPRGLGGARDVPVAALCEYPRSWPDILAGSQLPRPGGAGRGLYSGLPGNIIRR